jgi:hypothetical protein
VNEVEEERSVGLSEKGSWGEVRVWVGGGVGEEKIVK